MARLPDRFRCRGALLSATDELDPWRAGPPDDGSRPSRSPLSKVRSLS